MSQDTQEYIDDYLLNNEDEISPSEKAYGFIPPDSRNRRSRSKIMGGQPPILISSEEVMNPLCQIGYNVRMITEHLEIMERSCRGRRQTWEDIG